jgi:hypothetical protein
MSRAERTGREAAGVPPARQPEPSSPPPAAPDDEPDTDAPPSTVDSALDERQRAILDFERQWWKHAGAKEQAIRERFGLSPTRYYQLLNALLDSPDALAYDAVTVGRLRRLRATRTRRRGAGHR